MRRAMNRFGICMIATGLLLSTRFTSGASAELADAWSTAITRFLVDPNFFRNMSEDGFSRRFSPLVSEPTIDFSNGIAIGKNEAAGILSMNAILLGHKGNSQYYVEQIKFVMPHNDPDGHEIYLQLKAKLSAALREPQWHHKSDSDSDFWRKGSTHRFISIQGAAVHRLKPGAIGIPDDNPYVTAAGGLEEGDSEEL